MAKKSSFVNMTVVLSVICLICSALLGIIYSVTAEPIKNAEISKTNNAISAVVPPFDNIPSDEVFNVKYEEKEYKVYPAKKNGNIEGYAVETSSAGFGGPVKIMVGFTSEGIIYNTSVISHAETPGLGAKITDEQSHFRTQFKGKNPQEYKLAVTKDGGNVDAITASTITSRAYVKAIEEANNVFLKIMEETKNE